MTMDQVFKIINNFFSENMLVNSILGNRQNNFKNVYNNIIKTDIGLLNNDQKFKDSEDNYKKVYDTINDSRNIIIESPISPKVEEFFKVWSELIINWNNNTFQKNELNVDAIFIIRMIDQHYTIVESIEVLKVLNKRFKNTKNWNPPAFEIAPHYLKYLD